MPVADHPISPMVRHAKSPAGCFQKEPPPPPPADMAPNTYRTFTGEVVVTDPVNGCCQIGRKFNGVWVPLDECIGCQAVKDEEYIETSRRRIDEESKRFMKADQRIV